MAITGARILEGEPWTLRQVAWQDLDNEGKFRGGKVMIGFAALVALTVVPAVPKMLPPDLAEQANSLIQINYLAGLVFAVLNARGIKGAVFTG